MPLSLIFFDDELMKWASEIYIQTRLKPHVNRLLQSALSGQCLCRPLLDGTFAWRSLHLRCIFRVDKGYLVRPVSAESTSAMWSRPSRQRLKQ